MIRSPNYRYFVTVPATALVGGGIIYGLLMGAAARAPGEVPWVAAFVADRPTAPDAAA